MSGTTTIAPLNIGMYDPRYTACCMEWGTQLNSSELPHRADIEQLPQVDALLTAAVLESLDGLPVSDQIKAQVLMPSAEKLAIRLVPLEALERLRDSESDKSIIDSFMWTLVGALLAFLAGIPITEQARTPGGYIILGALVTFLVATGLLRWRFSKRVRRIRSEFYGEPQK